jgi:hypothetical protein
MVFLMDSTKAIWFLWMCVHMVWSNIAPSAL